MTTVSKSLELGDSNQLNENENKHYNVEEYKTMMQFSGPWAVDRVSEIHIVKVYNVVTCSISYIDGDAPDFIAPTIIESVPFTLDPDYPYKAPKNLLGKLPQRFLPRNTPQDSNNGTDEAFTKTFSIPGSVGGVGFGNLLTILNKPAGVVGSENNGEIKIGYNMSSSGFISRAVTIEPTSLSWLTDSNLNTHTTYIN